MLSTLITLIDRVISKEVIPFKGEPLEGVQLMGILESRALDFKNVIILGVNEGILPKGRIINSLIPYELKNIIKFQHILKEMLFFHIISTEYYKEQKMLH